MEKSTYSKKQFITTSELVVYTHPRRVISQLTSNGYCFYYSIISHHAPVNRFLSQQFIHLLCKYKRICHNNIQILLKLLYLHQQNWGLNQAKATIQKKHRQKRCLKWNVATTYPPGRRAERIEKIDGKRKRFRIMQRNTPEGILYVFRGRFMQQNA